MAQKPPKFIVFGDQKRQNVVAAIAEFMQYCNCRANILSTQVQNIYPADMVRETDFAVVFGGDGAILSAARQLSETQVPIIGVNVGKLGYLAEFSVEELKTLFEQVTTDKSLIEKRMMLACNVVRSGKARFSDVAVNDVVITAGSPFRMIEMQMSIQGQSVSSCVGDGMIVSTPTGSTAYNLSAGGPILSANLSTTVITPICPHSLSFRPIVIDAERTIEIQVSRVNPGTTVSLDGQISETLNLGDVVKVEKHRGWLSVVSNPRRTQWDTLAAKLNWGGKPNYSKG